MYPHKLARSLAIQIRRKLRKRVLSAEDLKLIKEAIAQVVELLEKPCENQGDTKARN